MGREAVMPSPSPNEKFGPSPKNRTGPNYSKLGDFEPFNAIIPNQINLRALPIMVWTLLSGLHTHQSKLGSGPKVGPIFIEIFFLYLLSITYLYRIWNDKLLLEYINKIY
jgi:hypothetical protein